MLSFALRALGALLVFWIAKNLWQWKTNLDAAKASGLRYIPVPVTIFGLVWLIVNGPVMRVLRLIPQQHRPLWIDKMESMHSWKDLFSAYDIDPQAATFLTVSPTRCMLWTAHPEAISQITARRSDFPKPGRMYRSINIYGRNLVTVEGQLWRRHRKITGPPFTEKNNHMVWAESIRQATSMVRSWTGKDGNSTRTVTTIAHDAMRLSLHVISRAGFGVRLLWPDDEEASRTGKAGEMSATNLGTGHEMTYTEALETLLHNMLPIVAMPHSLLKILPFKKTKLAYQAFIEWGKYMNEMMQAKKIQLASGEDDEGGMDLMGALVKSAGYGAANTLEKGGQTETLSDEEILGNAFVFILAGHETTGNTVHFSLIFLAMNLASQRRLQADLDTIFHGRAPEQWDYDSDLPRLFGGMTGAVMNETLRLIPPAIHIPKESPQAQPLTIEGREYTVPADSLLLLSAVGVHRNPRFWPAGPPSNPNKPLHPTSNRDNDLEEFKPERWLLTEEHATHANGNTNANANANANTNTNGNAKSNNGPKTLAPDSLPRSAETDDLAVNTSADTAASLYKPEKGAYVPFSEGFRSCIGRRFAQVEVLVVLALVLSGWSVELAVDEWASDEEVARMGKAEREGLYEKAKDGAWRKLRNNMRTVITIQLRGGVYIPLRFTRRGAERFEA